MYKLLISITSCSIFTKPFFFHGNNSFVIKPCHYIHIPCERLCSCILNTYLESDCLSFRQLHCIIAFICSSFTSSCISVLDSLCPLSIRVAYRFSPYNPSLSSLAELAQLSPFNHFTVPFCLPSPISALISLKYTL